MTVLRLFLGDVVRMRKVHPCGSDEWEVVRLGADIGIRCLKCGRRVLMPRPTFERRIRRFIRRGEGYEPEPTSGGSSVNPSPTSGGPPAPRRP